VLLVLDGNAAVAGDGWKLDVGRGAAVLVPYSSGPCEVTGEADILRCRAPEPPAGG
jgi:mannose-6-phosphate isomerase class I